MKIFNCIVLITVLSAMPTNAISAVIGVGDSAESKLLSQDFWSMASDVDIDTAIEESVNVNIRELCLDGSTPLHKAARKCIAPLFLRELVNWGVADVSSRDYYGNTPFLEASAFADINIVDVLISLGSDLFAENINAETALIRASRINDKTEVINRLISAGIDVNARDINGKTALIHAAQSNKNPQVLKILIDKGANVSSVDKYGNTALIIAARINPNVKIIDVLLKSGADVNAKNKIGRTALQEAVASRNLAAVEKLGKNVDLLFAAARFANKGVLKDMIKNGCDVNAVDHYGNTALMEAARFNGNEDSLKILLDSGADVKIKNKIGKTAFDYAKGNKNIIGSEVYWRINDAMGR